MKQEFYYPSQDGRTAIHAIRWIPQGTPIAVLQICHGMCEYIDRYDEFAQFLAQNGFCVVGNDHLGHGRSVTEDARHGFFEEKRGNFCVLKDVHHLRRLTQALFPGVPYFWLGHSMGSFLTRQYIARKGEGLSGVIIMGTGSQPDATLQTAKALCSVLAAARDWTYRSAFVSKLAMGSYNRQFAPARTSYDWLTKDTAIVDAYAADPWCTFTFTLNAFYNMFLSIEDAQDPETVAKIPKDLPVLLVSGAKDPVGSDGKGVEQVWHAYQKAGIRDLDCVLYPDDRHEILNETDRQLIFADLLEWMQERMT